MDRDRQSEMISAYLDGELTPSERTDAERLLENSTELREELNDFARLSDLLRALPREEAPAELAAAIRREAERKSLLGTEPSAPRRSLVRELVVAVSAMAATVVGMLLLPQQALRRDTVASREPMATVALESDRQAGRAYNETASKPMLASADKRDAVSDVAGPTFEAASIPLAMRGAALSPPPAPQHDPDVAVALADGVALAQDSVPIGDVVPYFQNGVGVMLVTVVDVESAGDRLAVILGRNGLSVLPEDVAKRAKEFDDLKPADGKAESAAARTLGREQQLMLVYVDASQETVTQVLNEMAAEQLFVQAKLQPPVEAPELADLNAVPAEEPPITATDKLADDEELAEQVLTNNAVIATENYLSRQQLTETLARDGTRRSETAKDSQYANRQLPGYQAAKGLSRMARSRSDANALPVDAPADASLAENTFSIAGLKQNGAALLKLDANSGQVLNNTVMIERKLTEKSRVVAGKAKAGAELKKQDDLAESEKLAESQLAERTVRLLVVLQSPAADTPTP